MNALKTLANAMRRFLKYAEHIVSNPALAAYTPTGPGSLATGQAGAAVRIRPLIENDDSGADRQARNQPKSVEYSMPSRQVFWI